MGRIGSEGTMKLGLVELLLGAEVSAETGTFESELTGAPVALPAVAAFGAEDAAASGAVLSAEPPAMCRKVPELKKYTARATATAPSRTKLQRPFMARFSPQAARR
jgi:hypothetical protein